MPAIVALALVAAVWVSLHAYEIIWWREEGARPGAARPASPNKASAHVQLVADDSDDPRATGFGSTVSLPTRRRTPR